MREILEFAKTANPTILLALCLIIIILMLFKNNKFALNIFKRQKLNTFKMEGGKTTLDTIAKQLDLISSNHLHELPDIKKAIDRIEEEQVSQGNRLTRVETRIEYIIKK